MSVRLYETNPRISWTIHHTHVPIYLKLQMTLSLDQICSEKLGFEASLISKQKTWNLSLLNYTGEPRYSLSLNQIWRCQSSNFASVACQCRSPTFETSYSSSIHAIYHGNADV